MLWRSSGEGNEEVLEPRNFDYLRILVPVKQTRIGCFLSWKSQNTLLKSVVSRVIWAYTSGSEQREGGSGSSEVPCRGGKRRKGQESLLGRLGQDAK